MLEVPDLNKALDYENNFYLSCHHTRISKILAHCELYKMVNDLPGAVVECGVFKGASFCRFAAFRELFGHQWSRKLIGFDIFGEFPETEFEDDVKFRERFINNAGSESISDEQLMELLEVKKLHENVDLVKGDINQTVPAYVKEHPELKISLLNLDTDIYEPAVTILKELYPRIVPGGILILDDYGTFPGETKAVDEYFKDKNIRIQKFPFAMTPAYLIKE